VTQKKTYLSILNDTNKKLVFCFFILFYCFVSSQNKELDSLKSILNHYKKKDTVKVNLLNKVSYIYHKKDLKLLKSYALEAKKISQEITYINGEARSLFLIGIFYFNNSEFKLAIKTIEDALELYTKINNDDGIFSCFNSLGNCAFVTNHLKKAKEHYNKALLIAKKNKNKLQEADISISLGNYYFQTNDYTKAIHKYEEAIRSYTSIDNKIKIMKPLNNISIIYRNQGKYLDALDNLKKCLYISKQLNNDLDIVIYSQNISAIYSSLKKYKKAEEHIKEALTINKKTDAKTETANCFIALGVIKQKQYNYKKASYYFQEALKIFIKTNNNNGIYYCYNNIGTLNYETKKLKTSLINHKKSLELSLLLNNKDHECASLLNIEEVNIALNKNNNTSLQNLLKANKIAYKLNLVERQKKAHHLLSKLYKTKNNYKKAYENHLKFKTLSDSLFNKENIEKLAQLEHEYKYKQERESANKRELKLTEKVKITTTDLEKSQKNFLVGVIIFLTLFIILLALIFFLKIKNIQVKNDNVLTEQKLLRSQMTPHFIFNSLAVLQGIILNKEEKKSISYLSKFSKLLRIILENSREGIVPLTEELKAIENYLVLQNIHNSDTPYQYDITIDETIIKKKYSIPPMLIQPFIENAIEHAFINKKENKKIIIILKLIDNELICTVSDNGIGIHTSQKKNKENKKSLATIITSERLGILSKKYNMKGEVKIEDLNKNEKQGTLVTIKIPYKLNNND